MKKLLTLCVLLTTGLAMSGCANTADGFGRDMERAGQNIQKNVKK